MSQFIKYLKPGNGRAPSDVVYSIFNINDLKNKVIIRDMGERGYLVFNSVNECKNYIYNLPDVEKTFEEVIIGEFPQKFRLDIDGKKDVIEKLSVNFPGETPDLFMKKILNIINDCFVNSFKNIYFSHLYMNLDADNEYLNITINDIDICDSSDENKFSYHILLAPTKIAAYNNLDVKLVVDDIRKTLPEYILSSNLIDFGVYKDVQNFRLATCHKPNETRIKKLINISWEDSLIRVYKNDIKILPEIKAKKRARVDEFDKEVNDNLYNEMIDLCQEYINDSFAVRDFKDNIITFMRLEPTYCDLCDKTHDNDNTLYIKHNNGFVYRHCFKSSKQGIYLGTIKHAELINNIQNDELKIKSFQELRKLRLESVITKVKNNKIKDTEVLWNKHKNKNVYNEDHINDYELVKTLVVHANMGLGKTKKLKEHLVKHFENKRIIFLSFRQTFTSELIRVLKDLDFKQYSDITGEIRESRIIIQIESLHRLNSKIKYDLIIMDEAESIFNQFNSGLGRNPRLCTAKFNSIMRETEYVLLMDANISDRSYNLISRYRDIESVLYHRNEYKNAKGSKWRFTYDTGTWIAAIKESINNNENIYIPTNSLRIANTIKELIAQEYPDKSILIYSSETDKAEKKKDFENVAKKWICGCLIITPTCTAGVSFEEDHFDKVFPYFNNMSCDVETCRQMVARVRNVKTKEYITLLDAKIQYLPTNTKSIAEYLCSAQKSLDNSIENNSLEQLMDLYYDNGDLKFKENDYSALYLENKRIENLSKNNFSERFISQIYNTGADIAVIDNVDESISAQYMGDFKMISKELTDANLAKIVNADNINETEASELREKEERSIETGSVDLTPDEKLSLHKYKIIRDYNIEPRLLTVSFIKKYDDPKMRNIYRNIKMVNNFETCKSKDGFYSILENIRLKQKENSKKTIDEFEVQTKANIGDVYVRHRLSLGLILCSGFESVDELIDETTLFNNIKKYYKNIKKCENNIKQAFNLSIKVPTNSDNLEIETLDYINFILKNQYDMSIKLITDKKISSIINRYELKRSNNFNDKDKPTAKLDKPPALICSEIIDLPSALLF
jgi:hypothetical protein